MSFVKIGLCNKSYEIDQYLVKLRRTKYCANFWATLYILRERMLCETDGISYDCRFPVHGHQMSHIYYKVRCLYNAALILPRI